MIYTRTRRAVPILSIGQLLALDLSHWPPQLSKLYNYD